MGAGRVADIAEALIAGGRAPTTPVAAVRWGTRPEQRTLRGTLATIADLGVEAPSAIVIGAVAGLDLGWFEQRPLFGRRIVVTRAREQASELRVRLEQLGAEVIELPSIALEPIDFELPELGRYEWVVFTSANGVDAFFDGGLARAGRDARALAPAGVAAIGPGTERALARRGIRADLVPERFVAESLLEAFPDPRATDATVLIAPRPRATSFPTASSRAATRSTYCPCTARFPSSPMPPTSRACAPATSTRSRSRRRRPSPTSATRSARSRATARR